MTVKYFFIPIKNSKFALEINNLKKMKLEIKKEDALRLQRVIDLLLSYKEQSDTFRYLIVKIEEDENVFFITKSPIEIHSHRTTNEEEVFS